MADNKETIDLGVAVPNADAIVASFAKIQEAIRQTMQRANALSETLGKIADAESVDTLRARSTVRVAEAEAVAAARFPGQEAQRETAASTAASAASRTQSTANEIESAKVKAGTAATRLETARTNSTASAEAAVARRDEINLRFAKSAKARQEQTEENKKRLGDKAAADILRGDIKVATTVENQKAQTQGYADRMAVRADDRHARQQEGDARRKDREALAASQRSERSNAAAVQAFAIGGPAGLGRHFIAQGFQKGSQYVAGTGGRMAAEGAYANAYNQSMGAGLLGPGQPPQAPPGALGGMGRGVAAVAGGAAAAALVGAGSLYVGYNQIQERTGKYARWEKGLRGSAGMGAYTDIKQLKDDPFMDFAAAHGIDHDEMLSAKGEYLRARGRNAKYTEAENKELIAGINQGVAPSTVGAWARRQGRGGGLSNKARLSAGVYGLQSAGLTEDAMRGQVQEMLQHGASASALGQTYDWTQQVGMTKGLSKMFGPERGGAMTSGIADAGRNTLSSLEASLKQVSDMSVLAGFAGESKDVFGLRERLASASPTDRLRQMQKVGSVALHSQGSRAEALALAGVDTKSMEGTLYQPADGSRTHRGQFSRIAATGERTAENMAMEGDVAEEVAKLHETLKGMQLSFGTLLPTWIQEGVYNALSMRGVASGGI